MNRFDVVDDDKATDADVIVCSLLTQPLLMADNETGACADCARAIQFRPHVPKGPKRICEECALPLILALSAKGELRAMITPRTVAEVREHHKKREH